MIKSISDLALLFFLSLTLPLYFQSIGCALDFFRSLFQDICLQLHELCCLNYTLRFKIQLYFSLQQFYFFMYACSLIIISCSFIMFKDIKYSDFEFCVQIYHLKHLSFCTYCTLFLLDSIHDVFYPDLFYYF